MDRLYKQTTRTFCINSKLKTLNYQRFITKNQPQEALAARAAGMQITPFHADGHRHIGWISWG